MQKMLIVLVAMLTVIGILTGTFFGDESQGNVAYASNKLINAGELDHNSTEMTNGNNEKNKAEFAYEMAKFTAKIVSAPPTTVENFKVEFVYSTVQLTAKVIPMIPSDQRDGFTYEIAQITTQIVSDNNLDIEKAKAEIAYKIAQFTTQIITNADHIIPNNKIIPKVYNNHIEEKSRIVVDKLSTDPSAELLRTNRNIEAKPVIKVNNISTDSRAKLPTKNTNIEARSAIKVNNINTIPKTIVDKSDITPEVYTELIDELVHVGDRRNELDRKVNINGEIRYHYALNSGSSQWNRDSSGIRTYLGADTTINKDWRAYGMLEGQKSLVNYNNTFKLSHLYMEGRVGTSMVKVGSFGYLMGEGNIYDSNFSGFRVDFGEPLKYTLSYGKTDYTKKTYVATVRYKDFDYNLETGVYHYQRDDSAQSQNTIWNFGGNYNFSNFGVGAMVLGSKLKDRKGGSNGYVLSLNYGELKTYRRGTYDLYAKYYNQSVGTYIAHGMNGIGTLMEGFKGCGVGMHYTFTKNVVGGIEYYNLTDKISGKKGKTWWSQLTWYF
ncbi:hypothetical protein [Pelosinus sp. sgz500959]|uniref:hypothetical protein n=1 Tax=Pelosinus sp. sgz500959 TaxID=3242472 RepID=UPI003672A1B5